MKLEEIDRINHIMYQIEILTVVLNATKGVAKDDEVREITKDMIIYLIKELNYPVIIQLTINPN